MKKLSIIMALSLSLLAQSVYAKKIDLNNTIKNSPVNKSATIAVSIKNAKTGDIEYQYNQDKLVHPASVLKILTLTAALDTLTPEYKYETKFALDTNNNLSIKLSGDPSLSLSSLKNAVREMPKKEINNIYIDDKALDRYEWGIGWMWDDETNPRMAKISPYNLNQNLLTVQIEPTSSKKPAKITTLEKGTANIINMVQTGDKNKLVVYRQNSISPNVVYLYGTIANQQTIKIPIGNPERFFITNLSAFLKERNINAFSYELAPYPQKATEIYTISNGIESLIPEILQNSNNFYAETLFKTAGGVKEKDQGTFENSNKLFNTYYKNIGLDTDKIILADGSGVSRNNLFSADWISEALYKIQKDKNFNIIKENLAKPNIGTMQGRLPELENNLKVKTGTLANNCTIAGYLTDKKGEEHIITIFIANHNEKTETVIELQNKIITEIYNK